MEKKCLVTTLKAKTGNTDLEVYGYMKFKISSIPEESINDAPYNEFQIETTGEVRVIGDGFIYKEKSDRDNGTNGVKSITFNEGGIFYGSNGDYELLVPKYSTSILGFPNAIRSDNITIDYRTFKNSVLRVLKLNFSTSPSGFLNYPLNITGSLRDLPVSLTSVILPSGDNHNYNIEDLSHVASNITGGLSLIGKNSFYGSFDNVNFPKIIKLINIPFQGNLTGNLKNVPISLEADLNFAYPNIHGDVDEIFERIAKNATNSNNKFIYFGTNSSNILWRGQSVKTLPEPGKLYYSSNGAGEVKVYSNGARTNLIGTYNVTSGWTYPS